MGIRDIIKGENMKKILLILSLINLTTLTFAQSRQIMGSGPFVTLPGRDVNERLVINRDIVRSNPGDYFWRRIRPGNSGEIKYTDPRTGETWGWLYIVRGDINYARERDTMAGFTQGLPNIDASGEKYIENIKTDDHSRNLYENGKIEDIITKDTEFNTALTGFKKKYSNPIPLRGNTNTGMTNVLPINNVPSNFPNTFWASLTFEGRVMRVIIANGTDWRISVSYWATDSFIKEFPNAMWSWNGAGELHTGDGRKIVEDITQTFLEFEN